LKMFKISVATSKIPTVLGATLMLTIAACGPTGDQQSHSDGHDKKEAGHDAHWGYEGAEGPAHWAELDPDFSACRAGKKQSPIDLTGAVAVNESVLQRRSDETALSVTQRADTMDLVDNGHTIQVTHNAPVSLVAGDTVYELVQYHFHAPSEHTIEGRHSPLEIHFVHQSAAGTLAVIGVLVEQGEHEVLLDPVIASLPDGPGDTRHLEGMDLDPDEFHPIPQHFYSYEGSLTTPPCTEGVQWIVLAETRQISEEQLSALVAHLHDNNRPVQPLGDRTVSIFSGDAPMFEVAD
jgi:carbonic anhydrase